MEKTGWYPASINPVRVGWYEVIYGDDRGRSSVMRYWCGEAWKVKPADVSDAVFGAQFRGDKWRGLRSPAK